jgi:hypothetical protein
MMNSRHITKELAVTLPVAALLLLGSMSPAPADDERTGRPDVAGLALLDRIGDYRQALPVYVAARPSARELARRADLAEAMGGAVGVRFDLRGRDRAHGARVFLRSEEQPSASFEYDRRNGNLLFDAGMDRYRAEGHSEGLPAGEEPVQRATELLALYDLEANPAELKVAHIGGVNLGVTDGDGDTRIYAKLKTVRFERVIEGLPVAGDTRIVVQLGENGSLAGLVYQWPRLRRAGVIDGEAAAHPEDLRRAAQAEIARVAKKAEKAEVTGVELVLYDDGRGVVEPAYHVTVDRRIDLGESEPAPIPYDFYLPIAKEPRAIYPHRVRAAVKPQPNTTEPYWGDPD